MTKKIQASEFIIQLIEQKKIKDISMLLNYTCSYYRLSKNTFFSALELLKDKGKVITRKLLTDTRKTVVLPIIE